MKQYILMLYTSTPRYFAGRFIYSDINATTLFIEIEWTKRIEDAVSLTYEETNLLKLWCDEYRSEVTQILDTSLKIIAQP